MQCNSPFLSRFYFTVHEISSQGLTTTLCPYETEWGANAPTSTTLLSRAVLYRKYLLLSYIKTMHWRNADCQKKKKDTQNKQTNKKPLIFHTEVVILASVGQSLSYNNLVMLIISIHSSQALLARKSQVSELMCLFCPIS